MAILLDTLPTRHHGRVGTVWTVASLLGMLSGPIIGGWLSEYYGWRSIFYFSLPLAGFIFLVVGFWLGEKKAPASITCVGGPAGQSRQAGPPIAAPAKAQASDPTGIWLTQAGDAKVRVSKCGGGICGGNGHSFSRNSTSCSARRRRSARLCTITAPISTQDASRSMASPSPIWT